MENTEIVKHLSNEIVSYSTSLMNFRSRVSFTLYVGPFILLGSSLAFGAKTGERLIHFELSLEMALALGFTSFLFVLLGNLAGMIEKEGWIKVNQWRSCIARLHLNNEIKLEEFQSLLEDRELEYHVRFGYTLVFFVIFLAFVAIVGIFSLIID